MEQHCSEEILSSYLDGDLASEDAGRTAEHLAECEVCRRALAEVRAIRDAAPEMAQLAPADRVWGAIRERLGPKLEAPKNDERRTKNEERSSARRGLAGLYWFGAPALAAALLIVVLVVRTHTPAEPGRGMSPVASELNRDNAAVQTARDYGAYVRGIDHAIDECRAAMDENPGNARVRAAYNGASADRRRAIDRLTSGGY